MLGENIKTVDAEEEKILKTIIFFDLFEYPLTSYEIWENLWSAPSLSGLLVILDKLAAGGRIVTQNGFYFLSGREGIIATRTHRYNYTARKIKIARRFARLFKLCPWVEMIAVANSLGFYNLRSESDIDFFIIVRPGKIWLSRWYCTGLAKLLGSRPTAQNKEDKICLSFYLSSDRLNLDDLFLSGDDPYFDYWRRNLIPLYNKKDTFANFLRANGLGTENEPVVGVKNGVTAPADSIRLGWFEKLAKGWQLKIMPPELKKEMNNSDGVVINDQILKLYRCDRRREIREKYGNKVTEIIT
jgi:hypothetical protein